MPYQLKIRDLTFGAKIFRAALIAAIGGLLASLASFGFPGFPAGFLCFYFPLCWLLWIACVFVDPPIGVGRLCAVWVLIDTAILAMILSITFSIGDFRNSHGAELVWGLSFLPVIFPVAIVPALLTFGKEISIVALEHWFGPVIGRVLSDWVYGSTIAIVQSLLLVWCGRLIHRSRRAAGA
jgi:hypothetical protein